jgi:Mrp family chromosome partitioning ATPase
MSFRNSITIVASPRPRVGKTLLARLLADFHSQEGRTVAAFDLNSGEHTLAQFLPERVVTANIRDINGQMALFDRLVADDDATKVIDLGHESFELFFAVAHQIGFVEEARRRSVAIAILFVVTPDQTSVDAYRNLRARFAQATLAPVHNELLGPAQHRDKYMPGGSGAVIVHLPVLAPGLR